MIEKKQTIYQTNPNTARFLFWKNQAEADFQPTRFVDCTDDLMNFPDECF
ncbi:MAG TPA: hypothetical protein VJ942_15265 [Roseovarius sp.]|nr:hypothetical protein [Roseovarius sp.]